MGVLTAFRPLRLYAVFNGRSTRTDLILFYVLFALVLVALDFAGALLGDETRLWTRWALLALLACPWLALIVRRLHDTGRTGRWVLLGLPLLGFSLWEAYVRYGDRLAPSPIDELPVLARLALAMTGVVLAALLLWDDEEGGNAYGPNPRHGPREVTA